MVNFKLPHAQEEPSVYDANKLKNDKIQEAFKASLTEGNLLKGVKTPKYSSYFPSQMIMNSGATKSIPYGETTLGEAGCAIFCVHNVLTAKYGIQISIEELAKMCADQGYYVSGKGTKHNLFDHLGCKRAENVQELFDALSNHPKAFVTLLVRNADYHNDPNRTGRHFVNLVSYIYQKGIQMHIRINDSNIGNSVIMPVNTLLATDVAWIWPKTL